MTTSYSASPRPAWDLDLVVVPAPRDHLFALTDPYLDELWAAHLGPSAVLLARAVGRHLDRHPTGGTVDLRELAVSIGIPSGTRDDHPGTVTSRVAHVLQRLTQFRIMHWQPGEQRLYTTGRVRALTPALLAGTLPDLARRHVDLVRAAVEARDRNAPDRTQPGGAAAYRLAATASQAGPGRTAGRSR